MRREQNGVKENKQMESRLEENMVEANMEWRRFTVEVITAIEKK